MVVYTDGSKGKESKHGRRSWLAGKTNIFCKHVKLPNHEAFDAEARAALLGLQAALKDPKAQHSTNIYICLDNLEVVSNSEASPKDQVNQFS